MSKSELLDECKKEIRSILISYQKGCYLQEFLRAYREFIGHRLPSRELGFRSDVDFLYSIQDAVSITLWNGEYHLFGIADEKSKHIQKMVCKQKPAKLKPPRSRAAYSYVPPPRFYEPVPKYTKPEAVHKTSTIASYNISTTALNSKTTAASPNTITTKSHQTSPKEEIVSLVKRFKKGIWLDSLLAEYEGIYGKKFSYEEYGFTCLEECIECISELDLVEKDDELLICTKDVAKTIIDTSKSISSDDIQNLGKSPIMNSKKNGHISSRGNIPESMKIKLQRVAERIPKGILASDFPHYFEEILGASFDLHSFGYNCLADFIDDASDIFVRKASHSNQRDYSIYPVDGYNYNLNDHNSSEMGSSLIDKIIFNIKIILEANVEGIKLDEFLHVYSINCKDSLPLKDLGFGNLEMFLINIKDRVPLKFEIINGIKFIRLLKLSDSSALPVEVAPEACQSEAIPYDAEFPDFQIKQQTFPTGIDSTKFIPVYVSSIAHPGHLYIHLQEDELTSGYVKLAEDVQNFYNSPHSKSYLMKSVHIKVGASCAAFWPTDQHWYRAQILSIPSMETVHVHYIDYGTRDTIPRTLLRYLKKEFVKLPAQCLRCCLAYLKPSNNASKWDPQVRSRLLSMCQDVPLMAKVGEIMPNQVYPIVLCDTNGDKDIYINDVLHEEGFADHIVENPTPVIPPAPVTPKIALLPEYPALSSLQAVQAQYFLQAFAAVAPSFAQNEHYLQLFRQISMYCPNPGFSSNIGASANLCPGGTNALTNPYSMLNNFSSASSQFSLNMQSSSASSAFNNPIAPPTSPPDQFFTPATYPDTFSSPKQNGLSINESKITDSELFDDDDDDTFQQFCQKVCPAKRRYVKRVFLDDGYKIHIVVVDSKPFASSGDISQLIWNNKEADYLSRRLQSKDVDYPPICLSEDGNEECFQQLERLSVKGVQKTTGFNRSIVLYPLKYVIKILNVFGHPSISLRTKLTEEITKFDPNDPIWHEFAVSDIPEQEENNENLMGVTDDDKIEKLCLYDLLAMREGIRCKRLKMMNHMNESSNNKSVDELTKLEQLQERVVQRIIEIKEICKLFA